MENRRTGRPPKGPWRREHFKLPAELAAALSDYATRHGMTKTDLVGEALAARIGVPYRPQTGLSVVLGEDVGVPDPGGLTPETRAAVDLLCGQLGISRLEFVEAALHRALARSDEFVRALRPTHPASAPEQEVTVARSA